MRDPIILLVHLIATLARLMGPGGLRSVALVHGSWALGRVTLDPLVIATGEGA